MKDYCNMFLPSMRWSLIAIPSLISLCVAHSSHKVRRIAPAASSALDSIPHCALNCVEAFIESEYLGNACAGLGIGCLCRTNTQSGYTLGEAALRCNLSFCPMNVTESSHVYNICDSITGAIPKTHATITATIMSTIQPTTGISMQTTTDEISSPTAVAPPPLLTSPLPQSTSSQSTLDTTSTTFATFQTPLTLTHAESSSSSASDEQPPSKTATNTATAAATTEARGSSLNAAAVIGVSITSGVSGFFILGVIIFFCCRKVRHRHQKIKSREFFEIGGVMSEPPDFGQPLPRRPTEGPPNNPTSDAANGYSDSETAGLMSPFKPTVRNPDVVVTTPNEYRFVYDTPDRIGFAVSTNSEFDASPSQASMRTISDLLPEKPNLYPEPLRWSMYKSRPASSKTLFEEEAAKSQGSLGSANPYLEPTGGWNRPNNGHQYRQRPMMGLPSNPRAMLYGVEGARKVPPRKKDNQYGAKPVYANTGERVQFGQQPESSNDSRRHSQIQMPNQHDFVRNYWVGQNNSIIGQPSPQGSLQRPLQGFGATRPSPRASPRDPGVGFETVNLNESSMPRRKSRHSGDFKPLTPVREVRTPSSAPRRGGAQKYFNEKNAPVQYPQMPLFTTAAAPQEIVSRPRIVRRDDIKQVQIRKGRPQPRGFRTPYSPEDCWFTPSDDSDQRHSDKSMSRRLPVDTSYPVESMASRVPARKPVSWGRKVTPSKRGSDLILRVE